MKRCRVFSSRRQPCPAGELWDAACTRVFGVRGGGGNPAKSASAEVEARVCIALVTSII